MVRELGTLTPEQRAVCAEDVAALREAMRESWHGRTTEEVTARCAADLGCQVTPEAAAT
ncbi:hypothetical protein OG352_00905 [Streptomyces sp. NBC_01485]|uniref:hypothetical protein n=1 Tax=Streptomyces sp. NBC_01485 TaxID=2903884 RepID=UPI002E32BA43|nr:hypothetical protein [Streptomyces sp. NBC_01485]